MLQQPKDPRRGMPDAERLAPPIDESRPVIHMQYTYPHNFLTVAQAFVRKFDFENRYFLTSVAGVEQLDDDTIQFYRRQDSAGNIEDLAFEKVTINRATKTITSELIDSQRDKSIRLYERGTLSEQSDNKVLHQHLVFDNQGVMTFKKDQFLLGVTRLIKTIKFTQFAAESQ